MDIRQVPHEENQEEHLARDGIVWVSTIRQLRNRCSPLGVGMLTCRPAATLAGVAALLLLASFCTSALPVFGRFARFKLHYASRWRNVEDALVLEQDAEKAEIATDEPVKRRKRGRSKKAWKNRMTRMFY